MLENKLDTYEYSESGLEFVSSMELDDDFEYLSGDSSGMLYLSPGIGDVIGVKDGEKALQTTVDGDLNMHPSGEWGISFWVNSDTQKIANQGGNLTAEPWILTGLNKDEERKGLFSMIDDVQITNSHIMVAGSMAVEDEGTKIVVYDYDGNQLLKLGGEDISSPDKLGSITGMIRKSVPATIVTSLIVIVLRQVIITKNTTNQESIMQVILVAIVTVIATLLIFKRKVPELY